MQLRFEVPSTLALALALTLACGGTSTGDGTGGAGGSAGSGGGNECSAELKPKATLGGPQIGFDSSPSGPGGALLAAVHPERLELTLGAGGSILTFHWVGPDLTTKFEAGEMVQIGSQNGWHFVTADANTAATYRGFGFVAPDQIPALPDYGPHLAYATQCTFVEGSGACGQPPGAVTLLSVEASTGAGAVAIGHGETGELVGWSITNVNNVQFPGYGSDNCAAEAGYVGIITAVGPALDPG